MTDNEKTVLEKLYDELRAELSTTQLNCDMWHDRAEDMRNRLSAAQAENAKLRELVRRYVEYTSQDRCEGCVFKSRCNDGEVDECWQLAEIRGLARELGIEGKCAKS